MIYLNEPIVIRRNFSTRFEVGSIVNYSVYIKPSGYRFLSGSPVEFDYNLIYVGHIYVSGDYQNIYINDIISTHLYDHSYIRPADWIDPPIQTISNSNINALVDVKVEFEGYTTSQRQVIFKNVLQYYKDPKTPNGEEIIFDSGNKIYNILNQRTNITPRIPDLKFTENNKNFWLGMLLAVSNEYATNSIDEEDTLAIEIVGLKNGALLNSGSWEYPTSSVFAINQTATDIKKLTNDADEVGVINYNRDLSSYIKIADVDSCPADYYLIWMDRTGAYQCQPFDGNNRLSEDITTTNTANYHGEIRPVLKSVSYKWTLNSKWLSFDEYKAYESIFVSPYIYLYDTKNDEGWWVNCEDSAWTEKNKSDKKPFNLSLNLSAYRQQNITY